MSLTINDIDNALFNRLSEEKRLKYVGYANEEIVDLAKAKGADPNNIKQPLHYKIERHAINVALNLFAQDHVGLNNHRGGSDEDVYEEMFKRTNWILQNTKNSLSVVMFTGEEETATNRAVQGVRLEFS